MNAQDGRSGVVVANGASAGAGRATARFFGEHDVSVWLLARSEDGLEGARRQIKAP